VTDSVDRAFCCGAVRRDTDVDRIDAITGAARKIPLRGAGGRGGTRPDVAHHAALRAVIGNIMPALIRGFIEARCAVIHENARRRWARIVERGTRWIDLRAVISE
jgi:hypothetical protein